MHTYMYTQTAHTHAATNKRYAHQYEAAWTHLGGIAQCLLGLLKHSHVTKVKEIEDAIAVHTVHATGVVSFRLFHLLFGQNQCGVFFLLCRHCHGSFHAQMLMNEGRRNRMITPARKLSV